MNLDDLEAMSREQREQAKALGFFDAGLWLGPPEGFPFAEELKPDQLPALLESRFLTGGLLSHWHGKTVSAQDGNGKLLEIVEGLGQHFFAAWTALPLYPAEAEPVPGKGELPRNVRAARIFPKTHHFPLEEWCVGSLCDWLSERRIPLLIWHTEAEWDPLYRLALAFPKLPIIVETQTQKILYHSRPLFALMLNCSNVHVELSNFAGQGFLEYAVREFSAERLIFGSFAPVSDPFVPMGLVLDADISDREKKLIAGANLKRLIAEVRA